MQLRSQLPEYIRLIALLALAMVFGHDLLMAAAAHEPQDVHTDHAVVEQCGPAEGMQTQPMILPSAHPSAAFLTIDLSPPNQLMTSLGENQIEMLADASMRRAMLQVFLN